ncbi:hypothetical protein CONPUDRAFT_159603 [Coniophora puteana RWD-64-598 SS2]|uniref:Thioredoxin-like protein n=1 Tax=Coniophora puteana (strain RWD-64-598) TaxID=741705 RepID=A0A5M3M637_CONPW|nr:uncharacterized protein CONPUDRAFT_159603 [Coniophora puteana RWD-64-598 SS2]EIW74828.1 hypothetical protein CONPUDRAFT_159603 [Coniophora puteana RWD-64-598 SS2]
MALGACSRHHNPSSPPSTKSLALLRAALSSSYPPDSSKGPLKFDLDVVEGPPTADQLQTILGYLPFPSANSPSAPLRAFLSPHPAGGDEGGVNSANQLAKLAQSNPKAVKWPVVVDWVGGRAAVGDVEGVKSILEEIRKVRDGEKEGGDGVDQPKGWFS